MDFMHVNKFTRLHMELNNGDIVSAYDQTATFFCNDSSRSSFFLLLLVLIFLVQMMVIVSFLFAYCYLISLIDGVPTHIIARLLLQFWGGTV